MLFKLCQELNTWPYVPTGALRTDDDEKLNIILPIIIQ